MNNRFEGIEFDKYVATYYCNKIQSSKDRNIAFNLTLNQVKNMLRAKVCPYTGLKLTHRGCNAPRARHTDVTIDRMDSSKPYETGNVIACSKKANDAKSAFESAFPANAVEMIHQFSKLLHKKGL